MRRFRLTSRPFYKTALSCPPSAGRGVEAFVRILPGFHAKITAGFFDDAALHTAPATPPCRPFGALRSPSPPPHGRSKAPILSSVACPPSAGRGVEAFVCILPGSHAKITAGFFDDAALRPVRTGLVSVRDRPRSGSAEKTAVGFCAGKIQMKASLGSPRPALPARLTLPLRPAIRASRQIANPTIPIRRIPRLGI